jgi:flagellar P-ring protein precursor FlgI
MRIRLVTILAVAAVGLGVSTAHATRIRELTDVRGVRQNQLVGYGLVVGLEGTGDRGQARFTVQSTAAMLRRLGAHLDPNQIQTKNVAAVVVTATLPPFANPGTRIDVTVSSLGNASSLVGGTLVQTPLYGADRNVYAVAQGGLIVGGFSAAGRTGSSVSQNHTTVGRIPEGAIVERRVRTPALNGQGIVLTVRSPSFSTAQRIVAAVDERFGPRTARAVDAATIRMRVPDDFRGDPVGFLASVQALEIEPDGPARVVVDERSGTVVIGAGVRIREVAIAQGGLTVEIRESFEATQPGAFSGGDTAVTPETDVDARVETGSLARVGPSASLEDVVAALNALGASPRDLISIFQALRTAGALDAELEVQ